MIRHILNFSINHDEIAKSNAAEFFTVDRINIYPRAGSFIRCPG